MCYSDDDVCVCGVCGSVGIRERTLGDAGSGECCVANFKGSGLGIYYAFLRGEFDWLICAEGSELFCY